jgi:DNA-binding response OmpR family regulator
LNEIFTHYFTAKTDKKSADAGKIMGEDFIQKPYDPADLKNRINIVLNTKQKKRKASNERST